MSAKRVHVVRNRKKFFLRLAVLAVCVIAAAGFGWLKKEALVREVTQKFQGALSRKADLDIRVERIRVRAFASVRLEGVTVEDPAQPEGSKLLFRADRIDLRYRLLDFISKKFDSKIRVSVKGAELHWRPRASQTGSSPDWVRRWLITQRGNLSLSLQKGRLFLGNDSTPLEGVSATYEDDAFTVDVPVAHAGLGGLDISTHIRVDGRFVAGLDRQQDVLRGQLRTEGTVVDWSPLPNEAKFDLTISRDQLHFSSPDFLGGVSIEGALSLAGPTEIRVLAKAANYALSNLDPFLRASQLAALPGRIDLELLIQGDPAAPGIEGRARVSDGGLGNASFKAMDLNFRGVYPTVRLEDSRILLKDGSVMRFADRDVELKELANRRMYQSLIGGAEQDTVVWGPWEFRRPKDLNDQPEFIMQRSLSDRAWVHFRQYNEEEDERFNPRPVNSAIEEAQPMEVGFEYRLRNKESVKVELREDERFVGIERKTKF